MKPAPNDLATARQTYKKLFKGRIVEDKILFAFNYEGEEVKESIPDDCEIRTAVYKI